MRLSSSSFFQLIATLCFLPALALSWFSSIQLIEKRKEQLPNELRAIHSEYTSSLHKEITSSFLQAKLDQAIKHSQSIEGAVLETSFPRLPGFETQYLQITDTSDNSPPYCQIKNALFARYSSESPDFCSQNQSESKVEQISLSRLQKLSLPDTLRDYRLSLNLAFEDHSKPPPYELSELENHAPWRSLDPFLGLLVYRLLLENENRSPLLIGKHYFFVTSHKKTDQLAGLFLFAYSTEQLVLDFLNSLESDSNKETKTDFLNRAQLFMSGSTSSYRQLLHEELVRQRSLSLLPEKSKDGAKVFVQEVKQLNNQKIAFIYPLELYDEETFLIQVRFVMICALVLLFLTLLFKIFQSSFVEPSKILASKLQEILKEFERIRDPVYELWSGKFMIRNTKQEAREFQEIQKTVGSKIQESIERSRLIAALIELEQSRIQGHSVAWCAEAYFQKIRQLLPSESRVLLAFYERKLDRILPPRFGIKTEWEEWDSLKEFSTSKDLKVQVYDSWEEVYFPGLDSDSPVLPILLMKKIVNKEELIIASQRISWMVGEDLVSSLHNESQSARQVQSALNSVQVSNVKELELASYFAAAMDVGGDYSNSFLLEDGESVFAIGDVSGKGIGPSLFAASCKSMLQACLNQKMKLSVAHAYVNRVAVEDKSHSLFCTSFLVRYDSQEQLLEYSSAGHNEMILLRAGSDELELLESKGLPLGLMDIEYEEKSLGVGTGDLLFLYTDGVTEMESPQKELFGFDRLEKLLLSLRHKSCEEIKEELLRQLNQHRDIAKPSDDLTFIILRF